MDLFQTFFNVDVLVRSLPDAHRGPVADAPAWCGEHHRRPDPRARPLHGSGSIGRAVVRILARIYIDIFRSIPLLVLLIVVYYALPFVGIRLSPFASAMTALTLVSGAYTAEIFRAGIEAIPKGQFEASAALGLSHRQTMVDVILPQAIRMVIPPLTNNSAST